MTKLADELKQMIFKGDPYEDFNHEEFPQNDHGWFDNEITFAYLIDVLKPKVYVEVGVWLGKSVRYVAKKLAEQSDDFAVIAIDNFLGSIEHWDSSKKSKTRFGALELKNGFPQFYYTFLSNSVRAGQKDCVVPFPTHSLTALRFLKLHEVKAELILIDASHEYPEVYDDLIAAKAILKDENSIIIGDDLSPWFPDVAKSVKQFMAEHPGWKMIKDGFGFVLVQPGNTLGIKIPKKPKKVKKVKEEENV